MEQQRKRHRKDRRDGYYVQDLDSFHVFLPYLHRNRTECEAFISERVDLTNILAYLEAKNKDNDGSAYSIFQVLATALIKTMTLRPALNRFVAGRRIYQRETVSLAFIAKKDFTDTGVEGILSMNFGPDTTLETVRDKFTSTVKQSREGHVDNNSDIMDKLANLPRWMLRLIMLILRTLDFYGKVPYSLIKEDPNYCSAFLTNLGSIGLNSGYHHLNNWGTNSVFMVVGKKHPAIFVDKDHNITVKTALDLGITLDERLADGFYYARSIRLLNHLLQNPHLLELPASEEVSYRGSSMIF